MKEGWEIKKLGEVVTFQRGLTYSKSDEVEFSNNCVLRSNNIELESMSILLDDLKYIREDFVVSADKKVKINTILICMSNGSKQHIGKVAFIDKEYDYAFGGFMGLIVPNSNISSKFVYYSCLSSSYKRFLAGVGNGANITNIKFSDLSQFLIPVPPLEEQEKIVGELDCLSGVIEKKKQQLKELDALAQSIFYEMFGNPVENDRGWEVKKLKDVTSKIGSGATPKGGNQSYKEVGISLVRSLNVHNNEFLYKDLAHIDDIQAESLSNVVLQESDVLLNITGASVARCCIVPSDVLPARVNQHVAIIRPNNNVDNTFICYQFTSDVYQQELLSIAKSNGATREALTKLQLESLFVILPPLSLQQQFADKIELIEKQKDLIKKSIEEVEMLFNSRMDYYFG